MVKAGSGTSGPGMVALVDSGLGQLGFAEALLDARPELSLVLSMDPDHMPWGPRPVEEVTDRVLAGVEATLPFAPNAVVIACNTGSVRALATVRARLEPAVPVIGTVPAIRPATATGHPFAVWATASTTGSPYQRDLIARFADGLEVQEVACPGFAEAVEAGDVALVDAAVQRAAAATRPDARAVVLGCTHYPLVRDRIERVLGPRVLVLDSTAAVARQALVRLDSSVAGRPAVEGDTAPAGDADGPARRDPSLTVLLSGRPGRLPRAALSYPAGRRLAGYAVGEGAVHDTAPNARSARK